MEKKLLASASIECVVLLKYCIFLRYCNDLCPSRYKYITLVGPTKNHIFKSFQNIMQTKIYNSQKLLI